jgi:O-antigen ligase
MLFLHKIEFRHRLFYAATSAFTVFTAVCLFYKQVYLPLLIPAFFLVAWMAFNHLDKLMMATAFLTPVSVNFGNIGLGLGLSIPAEPLIFGMMLVMLLNLAAGGKLDRRIIKHPVTLLIGLHLLWMVIATLFSTMVIVSVKATVARFAFVMVFYLLAAHVFAGLENIRRFLWLYISSLTLVIGYGVQGWIAGGMTKNAAHSSMAPFYSDHTIYAAVISLLLFPFIALLFDKRYRFRWKAAAFPVALWLITGLITSYSRAAWVSVAAAMVLSLIFIFRIRTWMVWIVAISFLGYVSFSWTDIIIKLESNTEDSSTDYREHLQSISNISTDASNVERVNRWLCALRMFNEKKLFGWGPGTYQFQYAPFQHYDERTIISTNFGEVGSSHSEYLGPLSEQGLPGMLLFMAIGIMVFVKASRYILITQNKSGKIIAIGLVLGLSTYYVHGFLNFFLDTDNASVPFWGSMAALTALQVFHKENQTAD